MRFRDQVVWITGASSGIGEGLAHGFHQEGADIIISARREAELERVKAACTEGPGKVHVLPFDIAEESARRDAVWIALREAGRVDILVNNAGISQRALGKDTLLDIDRRVMEVDYFGPIDLTKQVLPNMIERNSGHLVVTSSVAGKYGVPMRTAYCAAKHALHGFFDTLRIELLPYNINVTLLVIAGVKSKVSFHSLTGDGSEWGKDDWVGSSGMSPADCAKIVMDGMVNGEEEIDIAKGPPLELLWLKRFLPHTLTRRMSKIPLSQK